LAAAFAVDIASYAVMANHLHVVLRMHVDETMSKLIIGHAFYLCTASANS
jgi:REP element-mobilizing transposase RayT